MREKTKPTEPLREKFERGLEKTPKDTNPPPPPPAAKPMSPAAPKNK